MLGVGTVGDHESYEPLSSFTGIDVPDVVLDAVDALGGHLLGVVDDRAVGRLHQEVLDDRAALMRKFVHSGQRSRGTDEVFPAIPGCVNDVYEARMAEAFASAPLSGVEEVAFGDLFLEDVRAYREERLAAGGKRGLFPLWGRDTRELAREFIAAGFEAIIVCLDPRALDPSFAGRPYDEQLLAELPPSVDPCGENGEFHTFVHAGPIFPEPIACETGELVERDGFLFCDLTPA